MKNDGLNLEKDKRPITSFLLIGQSNMAGRGEFADVEPIQNENCYMLRMGRWQKMADKSTSTRTSSSVTAHQAK